MSTPEEQIYVVKEQGDLGLFTDPVSEEDQQTIEQNWKKENEKKDIDH